MNINVNKIDGSVTTSSTSLTYSIVVPDDFNIQKTITDQDGIVQETNDQKQPLYKAAIQEDGTFTATTEATTATAWEDVEVPNIVIDADGNEVQNGTTTVSEAIEWINNDPIMVANMVARTVNFLDNPEEFTVEEITNTKYKNLLNYSSCNYVLADVFTDETIFDLSNFNHSANTGVGLLQLLPYGEVTTNAIDLETSTSTFTLLEFDTDTGIDIYINGVKFIESIAKLPVATDTCTIQFINTLAKTLSVRAYAIGY